MAIKFAMAQWQCLLPLLAQTIHDLLAFGFRRRDLIICFLWRIVGERLVCPFSRNGVANVGWRGGEGVLVLEEEGVAVCLLVGGFTVSVIISIFVVRGEGTKAVEGGGCGCAAARW